MLVLSRKKGQAVEIGDGIVVTITQIKGNQVRLGIQAPPEVPIRRNELIIEDRSAPVTMQVSTQVV